MRVNTSHWRQDGCISGGYAVNGVLLNDTLAIEQQPHTTNSSAYVGAVGCVDIVVIATELTVVYTDFSPLRDVWSRSHIRQCRWFAA